MEQLVIGVVVILLVLGGLYVVYRSSLRRFEAKSAEVLRSRPAPRRQERDYDLRRQPRPMPPPRRMKLSTAPTAKKPARRDESTFNADRNHDSQSLDLTLPAILIGSSLATSDDRPNHHGEETKSSFDPGGGDSGGGGASGSWDDSPSSSDYSSSDSGGGGGD